MSGFVNSFGEAEAASGSSSLPPPIDESDITTAQNQPALSHDDLASLNAKTNYELANLYTLSLESISTDLRDRIQESKDAIDALAKITNRSDMASTREERIPVISGNKPSKKKKTPSAAEQAAALEKVLSALHGHPSSPGWNKLPQVLEYVLIVESLRLRRAVRFETPAVLSSIASTIKELRDLLRDEDKTLTRENIEGIEEDIMILEDRYKAVELNLSVLDIFGESTEK